MTTSLLDPENSAFIQTGVSISLAACAKDGLPSISRGLGCKLLDGGRKVGVFIKRSQSADLLANIDQSGKVANVFSLPSSNRTLQLKGIDAQVEAVNAGDAAIVEAHIDDFVREVVPLGFLETVVRTLFSYPPGDLVVVVYSPCAAFSQTPGPKAGTPLEQGR